MTIRTLEVEHTTSELAEIGLEYIEDVFGGVEVTDRDAIVAIEAMERLIKKLKKESV